MALDIKDLQAILDINQKMNSISDVKLILKDISHYAGDLLKAEGASILLVDQTTGNLKFEVAFGENANMLTDVIVPKGKGLAGYVAETREHVIVQDAKKDTRFYKGVDEKTNLETKCLVAMPLIHQGRLIGVIEVINPEAGSFSKDDILILKQFAEQAATAISNALLYREIRDKANELDYLYQISNLTNLDLEQKDLFTKICEILATAFNSRRISIMLLNEETGELYIESAVGISEDVIEQVNHGIHQDKISSKVMQTGQPIFANDIEKAGFGRNKRLRYDAISFVSVPIKVKNITVGVINISEPQEAGRYTQEVIRTLETVANQVGHTYESVLSYRERIESEKIRKEVDIMKSLQNALLIKDFGDFKAISVYARMKAAEVVGGDFYDLYLLSSQRMGFVVGDVSGKGLPASLYMAVSRSVVKAYAYEMTSAKQVLEASNNILVDDSRVGMFVTVFYGIVDIDKMTLEYSNAGHNLQYLYRPGTGEFISLATRGIPLGISRNENYQSLAIGIQSGDIIFSFTDGIVDAVNDNGEDFGMDRLKRVVREYSATSSATLVNAIVREVDTWSGGQSQWDDMTIVSIKIP